MSGERLGETMLRVANIEDEVALESVMQRLAEEYGFEAEVL